MKEPYYCPKESFESMPACTFHEVNKTVTHGQRLLRLNIVLNHLQ